TTIFLVFALLLVFSYFFRPYYLLVVIISIVLFSVSKLNFKNKKVTTVFYGIAVAIIISLSYGAIKGKFISQKTRENINEYRIAGEEATNSAIISPVATCTGYGECCGIVCGVVSVSLPINGLKHVLS